MHGGGGGLCLGRFLSNERLRGGWSFSVEMLWSLCEINYDIDIGWDEWFDNNISKYHVLIQKNQI